MGQGCVDGGAAREGNLPKKLGKREKVKKSEKKK